MSKKKKKSPKDKRVKWLVVLGGAAATLYAVYAINKQKQGDKSGSAAIKKGKV